MIGKVLGHYRIVEKLGEGGMGVVYRAEDGHLRRDVALKILPSGALEDPRARRQLRTEADALARLNHPNIATVFDFDTQDGVDFLVMELIRGRTLKEMIRDGPLPEDRVTDLARQLMRGLAAAHQQGVLHRDLKPGNLILTPEKRLKILDFGLAKLSVRETQTASVAEITSSGMVSGTLPYMPPEVLRGEPATDQSDIYSAGVALYEMATGRRPFAESQPRALIESILSRSPPSPRQLNPDLSEATSGFISACMSSSRSGRFPTAGDALNDLGDRPADAFAPRRPGAWVPRPSVAVPAVVLVTLLLLTALGWNRLWMVPPGADGNRIGSIAVLPLDNLNAPDQQFFADGITDALITNLAQIQGLRVISRTSAMQYRVTEKLLPEIARELRVDAVIEGSVLRSGNEIRITAQLVHAPTDRNLWAASYDRSLENILELQADVAGEIARQIQVRLSPEERDRLGRSRPVDPVAYEAYLRGRHSLEKRSPEGLEAGMRYLELAVKRDSAQALPYAGLANGYALLGSTGYDVLEPREALSRAKRAAERAVSLDDELAEAHTALAQVYHNYDWNWAGAEAEFLRALVLSPGNATAHQWYGFHLAAMGRTGEALAEMEIALDLDPLSPVIHTSIGRIYYYMQRYNEAVTHFERAREIDPHFPPSSILLGMARIASGSAAEALVTFRAGCESSGNAPVFVAGLGLAHAAAGDDEQAWKAILALEEMSKRRFVPAVYFAVIHAKLGQTDRAFEWLERAIEERSESALYVHIDPMFSSLWDDPRFARMLGVIGLDGGAT